jgi:hypothetical protein
MSLHRRSEPRRRREEETTKSEESMHHRMRRHIKQQKIEKIEVNVSIEARRQDA